MLNRSISDLGRAFNHLTLAPFPFLFSSISFNLVIGSVRLGTNSQQATVSFPPPAVADVSSLLSASLKFSGVRFKAARQQVLLSSCGGLLACMPICLPVHGAHSSAYDQQTLFCLWRANERIEVAQPFIGGAHNASSSSGSTQKPTIFRRVIKSMQERQTVGVGEEWSASSKH